MFHFVSTNINFFALVLNIKVMPGKKKARIAPIPRTENRKNMRGRLEPSKTAPSRDWLSPSRAEQRNAGRTHADLHKT